MRVLVIVKTHQGREAGAIPNETFMAEMGQYTETLVRAGVMLEAEGLQPSSQGVRVRFSKHGPTVLPVLLNGPFTENQEPISGFWLWQVRSMEEAIEWVKRCPNPSDHGSELEIRPVSDADPFHHPSP